MGKIANKFILKAQLKRLQHREVMMAVVYHPVGDYLNRLVPNEERRGSCHLHVLHLMLQSVVPIEGVLGEVYLADQNKLGQHSWVEFTLEPKFPGWFVFDTTLGVTVDKKEFYEKARAKKIRNHTLQEAQDMLM